MGQRRDQASPILGGSYSVKMGGVAVPLRLSRPSGLLTSSTWEVRLKLAPPDRIRAIASPIDDDIVAGSDTSRRRAPRVLGIPEDVRVVGTVARLDAQKAPLGRDRGASRSGHVADRSTTDARPPEGARISSAAGFRPMQSMEPV